MYVNKRALCSCHSIVGAVIIGSLLQAHHLSFGPISTLNRHSVLGLTWTARMVRVWEETRIVMIVGAVVRLGALVPHAKGVLDRVHHAAALLAGIVLG